MRRLFLGLLLPSALCAQTAFLEYRSPVAISFSVGRAPFKPQHITFQVGLPFPGPGTAHSTGSAPPVLTNQTPCSGGNTTSSTCMIPTSAAGSLMVVGFDCGFGFVGPITSVVDNNSNAYAISDQQTTMVSTTGIAYLANAPAATSITVTTSSSCFHNTSVWEVANMATSGVLDQHSECASGVSCPGVGMIYASPTVTTTTANQFLLGVHFNIQGATMTPDSPWVAFNTGSGFISHQYQIVSSTGSYASTGTVNAPASTDSVIATFKQ